MMAFGTPIFPAAKVLNITFENAGTYAVTLQVLDGGGLLDEEIKDVIVVENTQPFAYFTEFKPFTGTTKQVFTFRTSESNDSQYKDAFLEYRFDWNGDGNFDTPFDTKDVWHHVFEVGVHRIVMEVRDRKGFQLCRNNSGGFENRHQRLHLGLMLPHSRFPMMLFVISIILMLLEVQILKGKSCSIDGILTILVRMILTLALDGQHPHSIPVSMILPVKDCPASGSGCGWCFGIETFLSLAAN
ncbi:MAG: hypothetical protein R3B71_06025 [Candidatus Gracilibacteria bacterium]